MIRKRLFFSFFLVILSGGLIFALKMNKEAPMVKKEILENGLKVLVKNNPANEIVAIEFFIGCGSGVEEKEEAGLTYLTTRLLFKGTDKKDFSQIAQALDSLGAVWGFSVERDFSEAHLIIPRKYWKEGLKLFCEILLSPSFPEEELLKEKEIILQQIKSLEDDSFEFSYKCFNENLYGSHPYAKPTFGYPETIKGFTRPDIIRLYKKSFTGQNALISFVGKINYQEVISLVKKEFGNLPSGRKLAIKDKPFKMEQKEKTIRKPDLTQAMIFMGFVAPEVDNEDYAALKLTNALLGGGMSSRLFENIRDKKGIGYSLGTLYPTRKSKSTFIFFVGVQPERVEEAVASLWEDIDKIKNQKITQKEFLKAKNYLIGNFYLAQQRNKDQSYFSGWFEIIGLGHDYSPTYIRNIEKLEIPHIEKAARKYFRKEESILTVLTPGDSK